MANEEAKKNKVTLKSVTKEEVGETITLLERAGKFIRNYGFKGSLFNLIILIFFGIVSYYAFNMDKVVEKFEEVQTERHNASIKARLNAYPIIRGYLMELKDEISADRVFILETHNGGSNLSNLPFLYVDLTYAEPRHDVTWLQDEYKNIRLSRYPFSSIVYNEGQWSGPIENFFDEDPELFYRLQKEDVKYMSMIVMYGDHNPCGALGIVYTTEERPTDQRINKAIMKYSSLISQLLNNEK